MKLTPAKKLLITGASLALTLCAIVFAYLWTYGRIAESAAELSRSDADVASRRKEQQQAGALKMLLRDHAADFDRLDALSVSRTNPVSFLKKFEALAAVTRTAVAIDLDGGGTAGDALAFRFTVEGPEENVVAVLKLIERAPYELAIDDVSIQRTAEPSRVRLLVNVHVKASP